jgi:long-chain acyl-CoA synthetase
MLSDKLTPARIQKFLQRAEDVEGRGDSEDFQSIAAQWRASGIRPGDIVLLCMSNGKAALHHFFGALFAGAVPALLGPNTPSARLRDLAQTIGVRAVACMRSQAELFAHSHTINIGNAVAQIADTNAPPAASPGEMIMLTSGTSGLASGCVFDISAPLLNAQRHAEAIAQRPDDVVLMNLPIHFSYALVAQALASLICGNRLVIGGPPFHMPTYLSNIREFGVTVSSLTPVLIRSLLVRAVDLPRELRVITVGGDALAPEHTEALLRCRPAGELYLTYGLTQAGPRVSTLAAHAEPASRFASVGHPLPGTKVHLEQIASDSDLGQLYVSSASIMKRRIGLTEGMTPETIRPERCIPTGDIFEIDSAGYLFHKGRLSDFIVRKGDKVCLAAIRRIAATLPNVIRARTVVSQHDYGDDFDLLLETTADATGDFTPLLRKWLRHWEMPRDIRVNCAEAQSAAYK